MRVSACHQDVEIPAQALHEQVFFVLEFRIQGRSCVHLWPHFRVLNTRLSEAMLPEDFGIALSRTSSRVNSFVVPLQHYQLIRLRGLQIKDRMVRYYKKREIVPEDPWRPAVNAQVIDLLEVA